MMMQEWPIRSCFCMSQNIQFQLTCKLFDSSDFSKLIIKLAFGSYPQAIDVLERDASKAELLWSNFVPMNPLIN